nr:HEAT repeat domain-containing protein [Ramlibacter paludis]
MAKSIPLLRPHELPRTLLLAEALRLQLPDATLARLLQPGQPTEVVQAALRLTESLALADEVRRCLGHAEAGVREQAAVQMAQLARREDVPALAALLGDPQWGVRMAAARALGRLPFLGSGELQALGADHPAAAAQLRQVLAERGLG